MDRLIVLYKLFDKYISFSGLKYRKSLKVTLIQYSLFNILNMLSYTSLWNQLRYYFLKTLIFYFIFSLWQLYDKLKEDPPAPRNLPPIAGKIAWARQLTRRIRDPMNYFEKRPSTIKKREHFKIIHQFNKVAQILLQFEILYFEAWATDVAAIKTGRMFLFSRILQCNTDIFFCRKSISLTQLNSIIFWTLNHTKI